MKKKVNKNNLKHALPLVCGVCIKGSGKERHNRAMFGVVRWCDCGL